MVLVDGEWWMVNGGGWMVDGEWRIVNGGWRIVMSAGAEADIRASLRPLADLPSPSTIHHPPISSTIHQKRSPLRGSV